MIGYPFSLSTSKLHIELVISMMKDIAKVLRETPHINTTYYTPLYRWC